MCCIYSLLIIWQKCNNPPTTPPTAAGPTTSNRQPANECDGNHIEQSSNASVMSNLDMVTMGAAQVNSCTSSNSNDEDISPSIINMAQQQQQQAIEHVQE